MANILGAVENNKETNWLGLTLCVCVLLFGSVSVAATSPINLSTETLDTRQFRLKVVAWSLSWEILDSLALLDSFQYCAYAMWAELENSCLTPACSLSDYELDPTWSKIRKSISEPAHWPRPKLATPSGKRLPLIPAGVGKNLLCVKMCWLHSKVACPNAKLDLCIYTTPCCRFPFNAMCLWCLVKLSCAALSLSGIPQTAPYIHTLQSHFPWIYCLWCSNSFCWLSPFADWVLPEKS